MRWATTSPITHNQHHQHQHHPKRQLDSHRRQVAEHISGKAAAAAVKQQMVNRGKWGRLHSKLLHSSSRTSQQTHKSDFGRHIWTKEKEKNEKSAFYSPRAASSSCEDHSGPGKRFTTDETGKEWRKGKKEASWLVNVCAVALAHTCAPDSGVGEREVLHATPQRLSLLHQVQPFECSRWQSSSLVGEKKWGETSG